MKKNSSFIKHFAVVSGGTFLNMLIGVLTTPIITRLVDPAEYGQLSIFTLYINLAVMVLCLGLDQALVRYYYVRDTTDYKRTLLRKCTNLPILLTLLCGALLLAAVYFAVVPFEFDFQVTVALCVGVLFYLVNRYTMLILRLESSSKMYSTLHILHKASYAVFAIIAIKLVAGHDLLVLAWCTVGSMALATVTGIFVKRSVWLRQPASVVKVPFGDLIRFGAPFILSSGITVVFQGMDKLAINYFCDYAQVGIYSGAMALVHVFSIIQTSFNALWAPMATKNFEENPEDKTLYRKGNAYISLLMLFLGLCLILCKDVFAVLLGEKYREAAYILPCLIFNPIMYTVSETTVGGINFMKKSHMHIWVAVGACITHLIGNIILVPYIGAKGSAISTAVAYTVFFLLRTLIANRYFPVDFGLKRYLAVTAVVFMYALYNTFIAFNLFTVIGFAICVTLLLVLYRKEAGESVQIIKNFISKRTKH